MKWGRKIAALAAAAVLALSLAACENKTPGQTSSGGTSVEQMAVREILNNMETAWAHAEDYSLTANLDIKFSTIGVSMTMEGKVDMVHNAGPEQTKMEIQMNMLGEQFQETSYLMEEDGQAYTYTRETVDGEETWSKEKTYSTDSLNWNRMMDLEENDWKTLLQWMAQYTEKTSVQTQGGVKTVELETAASSKEWEELFRQLGGSAEESMEEWGILDSDVENQIISMRWEINADTWLPKKISLDLADYLSAAMAASMEESLADLPSGVEITEPIASIDPCVVEVEFHSFGKDVKRFQLPEQAKKAVLVSGLGYKLVPDASSR